MPNPILGAASSKSFFLVLRLLLAAAIAAATARAQIIDDLLIRTMYDATLEPGVYTDDSTTGYGDATGDNDANSDGRNDYGTGKIQYYDYMLSSNRGLALVAVLTTSIIFCACAYRCIFGIEEDGNEGDADIGANRTNNANSRIAKMTNEERVRLYNKAFDANGNQVLLDASQIIVHDHHEGKKDESNNSIGNVSAEATVEDASIYLVLEDARAACSLVHAGRKNHQQHKGSCSCRRSSTREISNGSCDDSNSTCNEKNCCSGEHQKPPKRRSTFLHPRSTSTSSILSGHDSDLTLATPVCGVGASKREETNIVHGTCIICFEDMQAGEEVVWSESESCPHVFHKECMVAFLAHKLQRSSDNQKYHDRNTCPVCRQHFVTVVGLDDNDNDDGSDMTETTHPEPRSAIPSEDMESIVSTNSS